MFVLAFAPVKFFREVRIEAGRVTWPSRRETLVTTALVLAMAALTAAFFFAVDLAVGALVRLLFSGTN
jgi:preprotein translocase subunit SecE